MFVIRWKSPSVWAVGKVLNWSQSTENNNAKNALTCVRNVQMANVQNVETAHISTQQRIHARTNASRLAKHAAYQILIHVQHALWDTSLTERNVNLIFHVL